MGWDIWRGKQVINEHSEAIKRGLYKAAEVTGEQSDQQVPLDEATLLESKTIIRDGMSVHLGYGGGFHSTFPPIPYAIKWHEKDANFQHGRKKNYLRDPIKNTATKVAPIAIAQELKKL